MRWRYASWGISRFWVPDIVRVPRIQAASKLSTSILLWTLVGGCAPDVPTVVHNLPDVAGEWEYSASEIQIVGRGDSARCEIEGVTLVLGPWRDSGFYERSRPREAVRGDTSVIIDVSSTRDVASAGTKPKSSAHAHDTVSANAST